MNLTQVHFIEAIALMRSGLVVYGRNRLGSTSYRLFRSRLQRQGRSGRWLFSQLTISDAMSTYTWFEAKE